MNTQTKTIVFGRLGAVSKVANGPTREITYGNGQRVEANLQLFEGGYEDYAGAMAWAEIDGVVEGELKRFSPRPGVWMNGVRV